MKYQVAEILIDTARFRISSGDSPIAAEPKVFDLLVYLIAHRDRVVTREELFKEVWDGREVSDATLSNHVKSARKVLGDSGELQSTIHTIRGRGYQFIAPVTEIPNGGERSGTQPPTDASRIIKLPPAWLLGFGVVGVLFAALVGLRFFPSPPPAEGDANSPYVVVVPFDVSGDASNTWRPFADQVTRELIRNLRKISGLRVVPATSAFTFKDNKEHDHIRRQLPDVQYVLDGVVSISAGNSLRITAELEDLRKGVVVWDKNYEGRTDDTNLFEMQSSIAAAVSDSLKVAILAEERRALDEFPTSNLKAYETYVAG
ncbi:MAG: winged helix-turn-helix domain-containing protein, partial [Peristeroidobacter soli]